MLFRNFKINLFGDKNNQFILPCDVINVIKDLKVSEKLSDELINKANSLPQGSLSYFVKHINEYIAKV
jgi:hypothetical protein